MPDMQPDVQAQDRSTKPDKAGVKDPSVGPKAADVDGELPARGKNVVDISRGARPAAETTAAAELPPAPAAPSVRRMAP